MHQRSAILAVWICGVAYGETVRLPVEAGSWTPKTFETGKVPADKAARFAIARDAARGASLVVGPWRAGRYSARYEFGKPLPLVEGQVCGWYRTEALLPYSAAIFVSFPVEGARPRMQKFELPPAAGWTRFAVPVRRPPPGSTSILVGVGLSEFAEGSVSFAGLSVLSEPYQGQFPEEPGPITRPSPPVRLPRSPFYRVTEKNGAWWLVSTEGEPLYSTGTDGPRFETTPEGRKWLGLMRGLFFNSLGGWTGLERWGPLNDAVQEEGGAPLAAFRSLKTGGMTGEYDRLTPGEHAFPDPFDPRWEAALRANVRLAAAPVRGKPWFVGFFADNEANHRDLHRHVYTVHCAAALRAFLERRYADIAALNSAWGSGYQSFSALIASKPDPELRQGRMYEDFRLFKREIVRRYVETLLRVIRQEDPGHLVFSNRFMLDDVTEWMDVVDLYAAFDGVGINIYPANLSAGLNASERAVFELVHRRTGKPVIVPEWSVPALDSGLYRNPAKLDWSYREAVDTQRERARQAARVSIDLFNMPFVVGAHWFIWKDIDNEKRQANRGLFQASGEPWVELQSALAGANRRIRSHASPAR
jgi:hypothetical protein